MALFYTPLRLNRRTGSREKTEFRYFAVVLVLSNLVVWHVTRQSFLQQAVSSEVSSLITGTSHQVTGSNSLASQHTLGLVDSIAEPDWIHLYQKPAQASHHYKNQTHPNQDSDNPSRWNYFNWDPYFSCPLVQKIGGIGSGAKWTCHAERIPLVAAKEGRKWYGIHLGYVFILTESTSLVYSIGSKGNFQFELALTKLWGENTCEIHVFDFGNFGTASLPPNIHYHPYGLKSSYSSDYRRHAIDRGVAFRTFAEIRAELGKDDTIDLFKIDCESCEWHTYRDWMDADLRQILMETHELPVASEKIRTDFGIMPAENASAMFDALHQRNFVLYSKEVNSHKGLGRSVEWSFLRMSPDFLHT